MIKSFRHKGLALLFNTGKASGIPANLRGRVRTRLGVLHQARELMEVNIAGYRLHPLKGNQAGRWSIDVNGPWRITFEWRQDGDVYQVDLEQPH